MPSLLEIRPHAYDRGEFGGGACDVCGLPPEHPKHTYALPGMENADADRAQANAEEEGRKLTALMRTPKASINTNTRDIEQHSPLFRDSEANTLGPGLFGGTL